MTDCYNPVEIAQRKKEKIRLTKQQLKYEKDQESRKMLRIKHYEDQFKELTTDRSFINKSKVLEAAELQYLISQWRGEEAAIDISNGDMSRKNLLEQYHKLRLKDSENKQELAQFLVLRNYIEKYEQKLGLKSAK